MVLSSESKGADIAKLFVRKCLSKRAGDRPNPTEALANKFITCSLTELNWLYEDMVLKSWVARDEDEPDLRKVTSRQEGRSQNLSSETGEVMEDLSQMALCEMDMNCLEVKERKRQFIEVGECDQENEGLNDRRKRRKVDG
jgi:hypothetical protein